MPRSEGDLFLLKSERAILFLEMQYWTLWKVASLVIA